jgi:DNA polymerase III delta subunit
VVPLYGSAAFFQNASCPPAKAADAAIPIAKAEAPSFNAYFILLSSTKLQARALNSESLEQIESRIALGQNTNVMTFMQMFFYNCNKLITIVFMSA